MFANAANLESKTSQIVIRTSNTMEVQIMEEASILVEVDEIKTEVMAKAEMEEDTLFASSLIELDM